jgi:hypothetical protein
MDSASKKQRDLGRSIGARAMVTVKSSQKIFTDSEVASLTAGLSADQWLFTLSDLMVMVTLFPKCTH